jgi:hypothetical protein
MTHGPAITKSGASNPTSTILSTASSDVSGSLIPILKLIVFISNLPAKVLILRLYTKDRKFEHFI